MADVSLRAKSRTYLLKVGDSSNLERGDISQGECIWRRAKDRLGIHKTTVRARGETKESQTTQIF